MKKALIIFCIIITYSNFVKAVNNETSAIIPDTRVKNECYNTSELLNTDPFINKKIIENLILLKKIKTQKQKIYCIISAWIISFMIAGVIVYFKFIR